jgi:chemotaxis protein MotB
MSADPGHNRIVVVKRHHHDHDDSHGGQWKIAYADFVTAMMAFFLIMWLLSSTTEAQREGIAKFFTSSSLVLMPSGNGTLDGGRSLLNGAASQQDTQEQVDGGQPEASSAGAGERDEAGTAATGNARLEAQRFEAMKAELERQIASGELQDAAQNIALDMTPEGLRLQIFDRDGAPLFASGSAEPSPRLARILAVVGKVLIAVPNDVAIAGHTDSQPFGRSGYSNWELSADRANTARRDLERAGLVPARIFRIEGKAASEPMLPDLPADARNRRISITVLRAGVVAAARSAAAQRVPAEPRR